MPAGRAIVHDKVDKMAGETTDEDEEEIEVKQSNIPLTLENHQKENRKDKEEIELAHLENGIPTGKEETSKCLKEKNQTFSRKLEYDILMIPGFYELFIPRDRRHDAESHKIYQIIKQINTTFFSVILCVAVLAYFIVIPVLMIIFGAIYLNECPAQKYLPIFLIVGGITVTIKTSLDVIFRFIKGSAKERKRFTLPLIITQIFLFSWFVTGCVWIYEMHPPVYDDKSDQRYCNKVLYLFTFWTINSIFILVAAYICFLCLFTSFLLTCLYVTDKISQ